MVVPVPGPRSSGDRAPPSGGGSVGSNPTGGADSTRRPHPNSRSGGRRFESYRGRHFTRPLARVATTVGFYARAVLVVAVLGPLEVTRDGQRLHVPAGRSSELVVRLALEAGALVSAERLVEDLWAGAAAETRRNTLQSKMAMLRRALGPTAVVSRDGGYALAVDASQVDALVAMRQRGGGGPTARRGRRRRRRGPVRLDPGALPRSGLEAAGDAEWADGAPHADRRGARRAPRDPVLGAPAARRPRERDRGAGGGGRGLPVSRRASGAADHRALPDRSAGRRAGDVPAGQRSLAEDLGLDPGPQLRQLEQQILAQRSPGRTDSRRGRAAGRQPAVLSAGLVGRDAEVAALSQVLAGERLVEIIGPGGIGKTAVALEVGRRPEALRDGVSGWLGWRPLSPRRTSSTCWSRPSTAPAARPRSSNG